MVKILRRAAVSAVNAEAILQRKRRNNDKVLFIGAAIGATIGVIKMGIFGLIMAFPGMILAGLIPDYRKPPVQGGFRNVAIFWLLKMFYVVISS